MREELTNNPMHPAVDRLNQAPRCGARARNGSPCRSPAVRGSRRCRMHGAYAGAPVGNANAWKHGARTAKALALGRRVRELLRLARELRR
jgi:hypothetical protein